MAPERIPGSRISPATNSTDESDRFCSCPVDRLSSTRTRVPWAINPATTCEPTKPAPPVTRASPPLDTLEPYHPSQRAQDDPKVQDQPAMLDVVQIIFQLLRRSLD